MGGLRKLMPKKWWAMLAGGLALAGVPPLAAFFSKDAILASSLADGTYGKILFVFGMLGTFLTGVYTFRMLFIVFGGEPSAYVQEHPPHAERGLVKWSMAIPVGTLAVLAVFGGWIQFADKWTTITDWLDRSRTARRGVGLPGGVRVDPRGRARPARHRARLVDLLRAEGRRTEVAARPRAQVLLRRAVRLGLLQAGRRARAPPRPGLRGARRPRLDHRPRARDARGRHRRPLAPDRARPHVRLRRRRRAGRPRPRLHRGQMTNHGWVTTTLILVPLIAALVIWVVPMPRVSGSGRPRWPSRSPRSASGSTRSRSSTSTRAACRRRTRPPGSRTSASRSTSGCSRASRCGSSG